MNLTREQFRNGVFARDSHKCVVCGCGEGLDAHHIIERRIWGESCGYYLDNGATLCAEHHIQAEQTVLSCEEIREAAGITEVILPDHFYKENRVDKWGNIILPDGRRLIGELFFDSSVQKILKSGGVLDQFCSYVKYPRTMHLPWSDGMTKDDRVLESTSHFEGKRVVVSAKMDGENTSMYRDYIHARSIDGQTHASRGWVKNLHSKISYNIPEGWRICGENLYAKHSISYENLDSFFLLFSIWNEKNECLAWDELCEWASLLELETVPVLYIGEWDEEKMKKLYTPELNGNKLEGYVVRLFESFNYGDFRKSVAKYVGPEFGDMLARGCSHWRHRAITPNKLREDI